LTKKQHIAIRKARVSTLTTVYLSMAREKWWRWYKSTR